MIISIQDYAAKIGISPQAAYKRILKQPFNQYVIMQNNRKYVDDKILEIKSSDIIEKTRQQAAEPEKAANDFIEYLKAENEELKAENKRLRNKLDECLAKQQETNDKLLHITDNALKLTGNSQYLMGYDKQNEPIEEPKAEKPIENRKKGFFARFR